jgi:hypothetical protein
MWQCVSFCGAIRNTIVFSLPRDVLLPWGRMEEIAAK